MIDFLHRKLCSQTQLWIAGASEDEDPAVGGLSIFPQLKSKRSAPFEAIRRVQKPLSGLELFYEGKAKNP